MAAYRAVIAFGCARAIREPAEKRRAIDAFINRLYPGACIRGRSGVRRPPTDQHVKATSFVTMPIEPAAPVANDQGAPHRIVIVGGGAAGLELATALGARYGRRGLADITLIDSARTHLWKPMLHAVAAGSLDRSGEELNYLAHAHRHHYRFDFGELVGLSRAEKHVSLAEMQDDEGRTITPARDIAYDTLVIAIGSVTNDFGTPGAAKYAVPLENVDQASRFHRRVVNACIRAQTQVAPVRPGQLYIAIVGGGATGTELSAELSRTVRQVVATGLDRIHPDNDIRITLIEATPRILPALPERVAVATERLLVKMGIEVRAGARVTEIGADFVRFADGSEIASELVVWAAGVKGPDVLRDLDGLEANRNNKLIVLPTLQTTRDPNIFAIGDCTECPIEGSPLPVPPRAQAAHQQAAHMVAQIGRRFAGQELEPYRYRDFGSLVSLGRYSTVGSLMGLMGPSFFIEGLVARMMYRFLHVMHEYELHGALRVIEDVIARTLLRRKERIVKLH